MSEFDKLIETGKYKKLVGTKVKVSVNDWGDLFENVSSVLSLRIEEIDIKEEFRNVYRIYSEEESEFAIEFEVTEVENEGVIGEVEIVSAKCEFDKLVEQGYAEKLIGIKVYDDDWVEFENDVIRTFPTPEHIYVEEIMHNERIEFSVYTDKSTEIVRFGVENDEIVWAS